VLVKIFPERKNSAIGEKVRPAKIFTAEKSTKNIFHKIFRPTRNFSELYDPKQVQRTIRKDFRSGQEKFPVETLN